jgi:bifunctional DNA-binding transcriptional regulator/antitoxin component of YhaV-PrlF toxin-antitoxin module
LNYQCKYERSKDDVKFALGCAMADMQESTVTQRGQTTLPRSVRQALALQPGDKVRYLILEGGEVRLLRMRPVAGMGGLLAREDQPPVSLEEMERAIAAGAAELP